MKIAQLVSTFPPYYGGQGNVAKHYAQELCRLGHSVTVFTPLYSGRILEESNAPYRVVRLRPFLRFGNAAFLPQLYKKLDGFDVVHLHYPFFGGAELAAMKKMRIKKNMKFVITYHMDAVGESLLKELFSAYRVHILPFIIEQADRIIVTSLDYLKHSDISGYAEKQKEKFIEVPLGVDSRRFSPKEKDFEFMKKHGLHSNDKIILFVGALDRAHYFKGLEYLIQALSEPHLNKTEYKLCIVGAGALLEYYQEYTKSFGVSHRVFFLGRVSDELIPKWYQLADVCILPSIDKTEAFGLVLLEAMACGVPVVATNLAGVRTVVRDRVNGFLAEPKNAKDLSTKISQILENEALQKEFGKKSREIVEEQYRWGEIGRRVEEVYHELKTQSSKLKIEA